MRSVIDIHEIALPRSDDWVERVKERADRYMRKHESCAQCVLGAFMEELGIEDPLVIIMEELKEWSIPNDPILNHLGQATEQFLAGKRGQHRNIDIDCFGLVESAHEILALWNIYPGFAANRAVHLGKKRCRDLYKRNSPHI